MSRLGDILLHKGERRGKVKTKGKKLRLACVGLKSKYAAIRDECHSEHFPENLICLEILLW